MPIEYLQCRDLGHKWDPATLDLEFGKFQLGVSCSRCGKERDRFSNAQGERVSSYWHPTTAPTYAFKGVGKIDKEMRERIRDTWQALVIGTLPKER